MRFYHFSFLLVVFTFFSCQKEVDVKIPEHQPKLVLNSILSPDMAVKAYVSRTRRAIGVLDTTAFSLENAKVLLFENGSLLDTLKFGTQSDTIWIDSLNNIYQLITDRAYFPTKPLQIQAGKSYKMTAELAGYPSVSAETSIPPVATITDISFTPNVFKRGNVTLSNLSFKLPNTGSEARKYYVRVQADMSIVDIPDTAKQANLYIAEESTDVLSGNTEPMLRDEYRISSDELTNQTVNIFVSEGFGGMGVMAFYKVYVLVYSVDADYDKYVQKYLLQQGNINFSLTPPAPIIMYSNVLNGYGILGGYSVGIASKKL